MKWFKVSVRKLSYITFKQTEICCEENYEKNIIILKLLCVHSGNISNCWSFYEGMEQQWIDLVVIFILSMDYSFLLSTIVNVILYRKTKWLYINLISLLFLVIAIIMKLCNIQYPSIALVLWYFYIWFLYGIQITGQYYHYKYHKK